jgi:signal transduction histidine kinase
VLASENQLAIEVIDNGIGLGESARRSGLGNLRRRAEDLAGGLTVEPASETGTHLRWTVPLSP